MSFRFIVDNRGRKDKSDNIIKLNKCNMRFKVAEGLGSVKQFN